MTTPSYILCDTCGVIYRPNERHSCFQRGIELKVPMVRQVLTIIALALAALVVVAIYVAAFQTMR
jgi:hypothetical protein